MSMRRRKATNNQGEARGETGGDSRPDPRATTRRGTGRTAIELLDAWAAAAGGGPAGITPHLQDAAEDLAVAADRRTAGLAGFLSRFGWQAGRDGWPLPVLSGWVETLARTSGAKALLSFDMAMALSAGWADGFLHGAGQDDCVDPTTGLARVGVLRLRIEQIYAHCAALGVDPELVYAVVVVDPELTDHPLMERNAARVAVASEVRRLFRSGETVAVHRDRVLVLVSRTQELEDRVAILSAALHTHPMLRHDPMATWVERLPALPGAVASFLEDLTA
jgi:hypothetical protein